MFNMITLYFFGPYLEMRIGATGFLLVYFGSGLCAHTMAYVMNRKNKLYSAVGASGSISGIVFAFCLYNPFSMIGVFFFIWMPAWGCGVGLVVVWGGGVGWGWGGGGGGGAGGGGEGGGDGGGVGGVRGGCACQRGASQSAQGGRVRAGQTQGR